MLDPKDLEEVTHPEPDAPVDEPVPSEVGPTDYDKPYKAGVGDWVMRQKLGIPHFVESVVSGDIVTRCGRRMADEPNSGGALLLAVMEAGFTSRACLMCRP